ncbi:hypothetical protein BDV23DRAFT_177792 [Aspergillus alliaceus]|uniref:Carbonic anhydrase n=1 Tax=Petromyces alliaceus TaxID=209559 RepID=A0A5N7CRB7_PETAA|nr:hypothetical protein BDV23DRAFT_177792 [Aspergillus alliaceus]
MSVAKVFEAAPMLHPPRPSAKVTCRFLLNGKKVIIVACMDARLGDPARALGLEEGDAHVTRNAGGRVTDALRTIIISQQLLGTRETVVVYHLC